MTPRALSRHAVRDVDDGDSPLGQPAHQLKDTFDFGLGQRARRLVEDEKSGVGADRAGNLNDLPLSEAESLDLLIEVEALAQKVSDFRATSAASLRRELCHSGGPATQSDVFHRGQPRTMDNS